MKLELASRGRPVVDERFSNIGRAYQVSRYASLVRGPSPTARKQAQAPATDRGTFERLVAKHGRDRFDGIVKKVRAEAAARKTVPRKRWNKASAYYRLAEQQRAARKYSDAEKSEARGYDMARGQWIGVALQQAMKGPRGIRR